MATDMFIAAASPVTVALIGLAGSLIGGGIAGGISILIARQTQEAARLAWYRDSRRQVYAGFLSNSQNLLNACLATAHSKGDDARRTASKALTVAHLEFSEDYAVLQTLAGLPVVHAARDNAYRLSELERVVKSGIVDDAELQYFRGVAGYARRSRHDTIDAIRVELGVADSIRPDKDYHPLKGTELEVEYSNRKRSARR